MGWFVNQNDKSYIVYPLKLISEASSPVGNSLNVGKELNVVPFH